MLTHKGLGHSHAAMIPAIIAAFSFLLNAFNKPDASHPQINDRFCTEFNSRAQELKCKSQTSVLLPCPAMNSVLFARTSISVLSTFSN